MDLIQGIISFYKNLLENKDNVDPCKEWSGLMSKMVVVSQPLPLLQQTKVDTEKSRTSLFLAFIVLFTSIKFGFCATLDKEDDAHLLYVFGAMLHTLGFGGMIIYITAFSAFGGAGVNRVIIWFQERREKLEFLVNLTNESDSSKSLLNETSRGKFIRRMTLYFWLTVWVELVLDVVAVFIVFSCLVYVLQETNDPVVIAVWIWWHLVWLVAAITCINDSIIIGATWLMCRLHLDVQLSQLQSQLLIFSNRNLKTSHFHKTLNHFFQNYERVVRRIHEFDETSRLMIWNLTYSTTLMNSSLTYAVISMGHTFIGYQFLCLLLAFAPGSLTLLFSATSIARKGKQLYLQLNSIYVRQNTLLTFEDKIMMKHLIENTGNQRRPSIALFNAGEIPYDTYSFCEYVSSTVLTFLMCVDFLDEVLA